MHIGLVGGIGPAATEYYYRGLIRALAERGRELRLTIAHADAPTMLDNLAREDAAAQAAIFVRLLQRLKKAGAEAGAITSIAGHFCIDTLKPQSPLPLIDIVAEVDAAMRHRGLKKVGLIGTRKAMDSRFYAGLSATQIVVPNEPEREQVHQAYVAMATAAEVTEQQRRIFFAAGRALCKSQGAEAVMLGGTDLFLAFDGQECGFEIVDCAQIHIDALAKVAASDG